MLSRRREISIIVPHQAAMLDAICADDEVRRPADGDPKTSQHAIVLRRACSD